jgi:hypothetical protein
MSRAAGKAKVRARAKVRVSQATTLHKDSAAVNRDREASQPKHHKALRDRSQQISRHKVSRLPTAPRKINRLKCRIKPSRHSTSRRSTDKLRASTLHRHNSQIAQAKLQLHRNRQQTSGNQVRPSSQRLKQMARRRLVLQASNRDAIVNRAGLKGQMIELNCNHSEISSRLPMRARSVSRKEDEHLMMVSGSERPLVQTKARRSSRKRKRTRKRSTAWTTVMTTMAEVCQGGSVGGKSASGCEDVIRGGKTSSMMIAILATALVEKTEMTTSVKQAMRLRVVLAQRASLATSTKGANWSDDVI